MRYARNENSFKRGSLNRDFPTQVLHNQAAVPNHHTECAYVLAGPCCAMIDETNVTTHWTQ